ncbi:hypothetical protein DSOUD_3494 [Desulfuromonas soudanensis]|uniref:HEAT repeat domain-containing protein n=1 Tax=Desulfuromonas soudanensis TaxID=1603606 RepID=A0A0M4D4D8_9BACT|nr:HEAT repeat domain-containing protein [Desulfuromonas soudanensis]ALC18208.1 hypothetical protein DSOUD_3494 [Desulfuromonas soudanensis]
MKRYFAVAIALLLMGVMPLSAIPANTASDILAKIEVMATSEGDIDPSLSKTVTEDVGKYSADISADLLPKISNKNLSDRQLAVYVWALGLTKNPSAATSVQGLYRQSKSELVKGNCLRALVMIGGKPSEDFLLSELRGTSDKEGRFDLLNLLGQMQCDAALPAAEEILKQDPMTYYWQSIFVFGKMGDRAIPFLVERINSKDRNVRANAINVLGQWLIAPEAAPNMESRYWVEDDIELKGTILSSLEKTIPDLAKMKSVFDQIVTKEKNDQLLAFSRETLNNMEMMKTAIADFAKKKKSSAEVFQSEYAKLFNSAGKEGNYEAIGVYSTKNDEQKLKALRERILQRDSDEAFYDYQKINDIIIRNRLAAI